jgi:glycosyltransferase involved in cell wall biosynthesis
VKTVLIFSWFYLPFVGGAELFVREIVSRLSSRYRFLVVTARLDRSLPRRETMDGADVFRVGLGRGMDKFTYPVLALRRALALERVDVVHAIMVNASALAARWFRLFRKAPSILTLQDGDSEEYVRRYLGPFFPLYPRLHRPFDRIHAISRHLRDQAVRYGAEANRIAIVPNGVDTRSFSNQAAPASELAQLRERLDLSDRRVVVSASRLALKNGIDDLLRAIPAIARRHHDAALLLVGDGEERPRLEKLANELQVKDRVRFVGGVAHRDVPKYLLLADVFVRPSLSEGLGTAFLEAMSCGVPIVGTNVGGIPEFLEHERTGLLCEPRSPASVADAVNRLLGDETLRKGVAERGRALVERDYRWETVADRIAAMYDEAVGAEPA